MTRIKLGLSPCPNDTFIFHALLHGLVKPDYTEQIQFEPYFADVEDLNARALAGELALSKVSAGVVPHILDKYALLASGAALGWCCGPLIVARVGDFEPHTAKIAIPGRHTTANLLLDLHGGFGGERIEMLFSDIMPAVTRGDAELGLIIHEGRFTYGEHGLSKVLDLGQWWEATFQLPLPLGVIAVRRDIAPALALAIQNAIRASILYARENPAVAAAFISKHAQELDENVTRAHIDTFVTDYSLDLGSQGRQAIGCLLGAAGGIDSGKILFGD